MQDLLLIYHIFFSNYNGGIAIHSHLKTMIYNVFNIVFAFNGCQGSGPTDIPLLYIQYINKIFNKLV